MNIKFKRVNDKYVSEDNVYIIEKFNTFHGLFWYVKKGKEQIKITKTLKDAKEYVKNLSL